MKKNFCGFFCSFLLFFTACGVKEVTHFTIENQSVSIFPDYTQLIIPYNIAPMNFEIKEEGECYQAKFFSAQGESILVESKNGEIQIPNSQWHALLEQNKGDTLRIELFIYKLGEWHKYPVLSNYIAKEPIDAYLTYRLIEPSYRYWREMGIYQRNLETFDEKSIFTNCIANGDYANKQCMNCHTYQNHKSDRFLFHLRAGKGGTVFYDHGTYTKMDMKTDSTISAAVYPSWHPFLNLVAFSTNVTSQSFHAFHSQKVEVMDMFSDLVLYDVDKKKLTPIFATDSILETFPTWSPDGKWLYYCAATNLPSYKGQNHRRNMYDHYKDIHYHLLRIPYYEENGSFGIPDTVIRINKTKASISFPRVSPDGRYVMFTAANYGTFSIWHQSSDLYVMDLQEGRMHALKEANSQDVDSYHSWSANGRWFVFSSRRLDGQYTRSYISYFDTAGNASKAFLLPQKNPSFNLSNYKAYNIPELSSEPNQTDYRVLERLSKEEAEFLHKE